MTNSSIILQLSPHLFWDTDRDAVDIDKHASFIVKRTLEYGLWNDWLLIKAYYGISTITQIAQGLRALDDKSLNFIATISGSSKQTFRCYTTKPLMQGHWNY